MKNCKDDRLNRIHKSSFGNMENLYKDKHCGCFHCGAMFNSKDIYEWVHEIGDLRTALCPYCGVDSVISESCGEKITKKLLAEMHEHYFKVEGIV